MADTEIKNFKWSQLFNFEYLHTLAQDLKYFNVIDVEIDNEFQQTEINGAKNYSRSSLDKSFELIPNQVTLEKDKSFTFHIKKSFDLKNFPQVLNFIYNHCQYIYDFMEEKEINEIALHGDINIAYSNSFELMESKLLEYGVTKKWLEVEYSDELNPLILAAMIQKFYWQDLDTKFNIRPNTNLIRIKRSLKFVNNLLDENIDLLKNYQINPDVDACIKNRVRFEFLDNVIFESSNSNFDLYTQNMDIKFLSYISQLGLNDIASKFDEAERTVQFGQSYFQKEKVINEEHYTSVL